MHLKIGEWYLRRDEVVVQCTGVRDHGEKRFRAGGFWYCGDGAYSQKGQNQFDLVKEVRVFLRGEEGKKREELRLIPGTSQEEEQLVDRFAMAAMAKLWNPSSDPNQRKKIAEESYMMAYAMMDERERLKAPTPVSFSRKWKDFEFTKEQIEYDVLTRNFVKEEYDRAFGKSNTETLVLEYGAVVEGWPGGPRFWESFSGTGLAFGLGYAMVAGERLVQSGDEWFGDNGWEPVSQLFWGECARCSLRPIRRKVSDPSVRFLCGAGEPPVGKFAKIEPAAAATLSADDAGEIIVPENFDQIISEPIQAEFGEALVPEDLVDAAENFFANGLPIMRYPNGASWEMYCGQSTPDRVIDRNDEMHVADGWYEPLPKMKGRKASEFPTSMFRRRLT